MKKQYSQKILRLQPIPETEYVRVLFVGKIKLVININGNTNKEECTPTVEEMMREIWKVAGKYKCENDFSGHLAFAKSLHFAQLLEGPEDVVSSLMERIRNDHRVLVYREFSKKLLTMNSGWKISRCNSFRVTQSELELIQNPNHTLENLFNMITDTYQIRRCGIDLPEFYRKTVDIFLLKYISLDYQQLLNFEVV